MTRIASLCSIAGSFQLTHPWGCDEERTASNGIITISTHTPVRVWLSSMGSSAFQTIISTHTPVRVWRSVNQFMSGTSDFNSHTREGVTAIWNAIKKLIRIFQLTHPWGCDILILHYKWFLKFQLTHPWGCDSVMLGWAARLWFQLTHPWGCDSKMIMSIPFSTFQLTHPWGCDSTESLYAPITTNFNSHTREGVTRYA